MRYSVTLTADAADDFRHLDGSQRISVAKQLRKLETSPLLGEPLGNRAGLNLTGYYKLYAAQKSIRIVYRIIEQKVMVEVVAIGKREDMSVYKTSLKRISPQS
ncbi:MAG: type II toxin-antitoxin system RelE/ParE family toxin [Nitrospira sp.]|nr:type II toxin-antitoxin system RelE/ParE family toxin [Nitrospira sp.]